MSDIAPVLDFRLHGAVIAASVAIALWACSRVWEFFEQRQQARKRQKNLVRALFAEIDFNQRDMERFLEKSPGPDVVRAALEENPDLVPHITDARHTEIYRNRIGELHDISDNVLRETIEFYGLLEKIRVQIEAINYPSFKTLSLEGQNNAVDVIRRTAQEASAIGADLLRMFDREHEMLGLTRISRETEEGASPDAAKG